MARAQVKIKYNEAFKIEQRRIQTEQENFQKHMSVINFNKETVIKTVEELDQGTAASIGANSGSQDKNGAAAISNKIDNYRKIQEELETQTNRLTEA